MIHPTAHVDSSAVLGTGTKVWHYAHIRENARLGENCIVGMGAYVDHDVAIGDNVKIQNGVFVYYRAEIGDGVFIGPGACLTNDKRPRAVTAEGRPKLVDDWSSGLIRVESGASIGAGAVVLTDLTIGAFAMVGAAALVTRDVPAHSLVLGVPARLSGYVCSAGHRMHRGDGTDYSCPDCGEALTVDEG